jgi:hypothetical protein
MGIGAAVLRHRRPFSLRGSPKDSLAKIAKSAKSAKEEKANGRL